MKKRVLAILFAIALVATCLFTLAACEEEKVEDYGIVYGKKYILGSDIHEKATEQHYYIFYRNGMCKYHSYSKDVGANNSYIIVRDYTVQYRFTFVDEDKSTIVYFYDGVTDDSTFTDASGNVTTLKESDYWKQSEFAYEYLPDTDDSSLITVSKNVLCTVGTYGYAFYVNEDYVSNLPNFAPVEED